MTAATEGQDWDARLMSWENFREQFLEPGLAMEVPVAGEPAVTIFAEPNGVAIGLRTSVAFGTNVPKSVVDTIEVDVVDDTLRVRTWDSELFQPFFAFLLDVSNRIQLDGQPPVTALNSAIASWRRMLAAPNIMSDELQVGLAGELWTLYRLALTTGAGAVEAWTGPDRQAHDFRLQNSELEVKTTTGETRRHIISRLDQLVPSPGMDFVHPVLAVGRRWYQPRLDTGRSGVGPASTPRR